MSTKKVNLCIVMFLFISVLSLGTNYYVAPYGDDSNPGTINQPWKTAAKALNYKQTTDYPVQPGDTIFFREGIYRTSVSAGGYTGSGPIGTCDLPENSNPNNPYTFKAYENEEVVITCMKIMDPNNFVSVEDMPHVYEIAIAPQQLGASNVNISRIANCSHNGIPLKLMTAHSGQGSPNMITGSGQWIRNTDDWKLYVRLFNDSDPNQGTEQIELGNFILGGSNTLECNWNWNFSNPISETLPIVFENIIFEGGYYPVNFMNINYVVFRGCTFRNCYGDAVKVSSYANYGTIENCDIYYFGENGIDVTGGDYWKILGNKIHDGVAIRGNITSGKQTNALVFKNKSEGCVAMQNTIYDMDCNIFFGLIALGDAPNLPDQAVNVIIKNNLIYDCIAPSVVQFVASRNCGFYNNLVYGCDFSQAFIVTRVPSNGPDIINKNCEVKQNIFYNNTAHYGSLGQIHWAFWEYQASQNRSIDESFNYDYNIIYTSQDYAFTYSIDGQDCTLSEARALGFENHSLTNTPTFVGSQNYDFHSLPDSSQVDVGDPNVPNDPNDFNPYDPNEVDYDGLERVYNNIVDIGPYEYSPIVWNISQDIIYGNIQCAIDEADNGDEIVVYPGTYYEQVDFGYWNGTLRSVDPNDWDIVAATVIDANVADPQWGDFAVTIEHGQDQDTVLKGLTLTGGCCGVYIGRDAGPTIQQCIIRDNDYGIDVNNWSAGAHHPLLRNNKIYDNGNGITNYNSNAYSVICNNWIYSNAYGSGIRIYGLGSRVYNNTIVDNVPYGVYSAVEPNDVTITNCILYNNSTSDLYGCNATYSCISDGGAGEGNISADPNFADAVNYNFHLNHGSDCIDSGDPNIIYIDHTDIDGEDRIMDGDGDQTAIVDMGADEYNPD